MKLGPLPTLCAVLLGAGCASAPLPAELRFDRPVVLLGEVHDNAAQHALRLRAFEAALAAGARPALALEQFDREQQPTIDRLLARTPRPTADELIAAAGGPPSPPGTGWNWAFYRPFIALALQHGLPIVAANVSRGDARKVMREGLAASGFDASVPAEVMAEHGEDIVASHCGLLDATTAGRMALAQVARDQFMARVLEANAARGVVLLAGNGHVRTDVGAPRWLAPATRAQSLALGLLEEDGKRDGSEPGRPPFDRFVLTKAQARPDPCAQMRARPAPALPATSPAAAPSKDRPQ